MVTKYIKQDQIHIASVYVFAIIIAVGLSYVPNINQPIGKYGLVGGINLKNEKESNVLFFNKKSFENLNIRAESYVIYDLVDKKVIVGKNEDKVLPLASLTKVMTAMTALSMAPKNKAISIEKKNIEDGYDLGLKKNQIWKLDELLKYTLVFSSNDGALTIADALGGKDDFTERMNKNSKILGLDLFFTHPAGVDERGKIGGLGSALSVAKMMGEAQKEIPEIMDSTTHERVSVVSSSGTISGVPNTNQDLSKFIGIESSKTGFTDKAGGNLAIVVDVTVGRPMAIVVLGSTKNDRFTDVKTLYEALRESVYGGTGEGVLVKQ